jgi:hypothetical protein
MSTKSAKSNVSLEATLNAIMGKLAQQDERLNGMATLISAAPAKPAPKVMPAKAAQELSISSYSGKHGNGLLIKFGSAKWGLMIYPEQWELIKKHAGEINNAFAKLPK